MPLTIVFETHSLTEDNERGRATGWLPGRLSEEGRRLARELGERRRDDGIVAVFASDLRRAVETAEIAFEGTSMPLLLDWRLRECDYGDLNGAPTADPRMRRADHLDEPYPRGESWRQAIERGARFVDDLAPRWAEKRVLVIGHVATWCALEHRIHGTPIETLVTSPFEWRLGWEYRLEG